MLNVACVVKSRFGPVSSSLFPSSHNATDPQPNSQASFMHDWVTKAVEIHSGNVYKIWHGNVLRMTMLHHFFSISKRWNISFVLHQLCNLLMQDSRNLTAILSHSFHTYDNGTARFMNSQLYRWYHKKRETYFYAQLHKIHWGKYLYFVILFTITKCFYYFLIIKSFTLQQFDKKNS